MLTTTVLVTTTGLHICTSCARREGLRTQAPGCIGRRLLVAVPCEVCAIDARPPTRLHWRSPSATHSARDAASR